MMTEPSRGVLRAVAAGALALGVALPASAASVFLNGVKIDGVTNQKFENCTVELDANGNVQIKAKGYQVQVQQAPVQPQVPGQQPYGAPPGAAPQQPYGAPQGAAPGYAPYPQQPAGYPPQGYAPAPQQPPPNPQPVGTTLTRRYFMVTEMNAAGAVQYDVDIFINSVWVKKVWDDEDQRLYFEVSRYLRPGRNVVHFTATKKTDQARRSNAPGHYFKVTLGEGNVGGDTIMIDNPLLEYRRNAAETTTFNDDFVVNAR